MCASQVASSLYLSPATHDRVFIRLRTFVYIQERTTCDCCCDEGQPFEMCVVDSPAVDIAQDSGSGLWKS